jgi:predicted nucleic acid-binding protein
MRQEVLLDTGPLVAFLNRRDASHDWASGHWQQLSPPMLTNESVLSEASFLLAEFGGDPDAVFELLEREVVRVSFDLEHHATAVRKLMRKYRATPMSLADACLVRMSELGPDTAVFTLDRDFNVYRRHGRQVIPLIGQSTGRTRQR